MTSEFIAESNPPFELCLAAAARAPENPFYTPAYMNARRALGFRPWIIGVRRGGVLACACPAFMKTGRLTRMLDIPSVTGFASPEDADTFWSGLRAFCRRSGVSNLLIHSFASGAAAIPALAGETSRRARCEYVLELRGPGGSDRLSSNHLRNIKRARNAGVQVTRAADERATLKHATLTGLSLQRRKSAGESVPEPDGDAEVTALIRSGAAEIFQAALNGTTCSSVLVLNADCGAYYHSAGTSSEGTTCGASHLLVHEIAASLRDRGRAVLNLGGAGDADVGLKRFKAGFGSTSVRLEEAEIFLGGPLRRLVIGAGLLRGSRPSPLAG